MKKIILCADDFGISTGVNDAILELLRKKRLSAVSCMSLTNTWMRDGGKLKDFQDTASLGLHITLTYLPSASSARTANHPSEFARLLQTWGRYADKQQLYEEINMQFELFRQATGKAPDFIDGHQHIHVLPVIRDIIFQLRKKHAPLSWMRNVVDSTLFFSERKRQILSIIGFYHSHLLNTHQIPHNKQIFGFYDYHQSNSFEKLMRHWICNANNQRSPLIYCHPGVPDQELARYDNILSPRAKEYEFLLGDVFQTWLNSKIKLVTSPN